MIRICKYKNGVIHVYTPDKCDREKLKKETEEFLKKVINGGKK